MQSDMRAARAGPVRSFNCARQERPRQPPQRATLVAGRPRAPWEGSVLFIDRDRALLSHSPTTRLLGQ